MTLLFGLLASLIIAGGLWLLNYTSYGSQGHFFRNHSSEVLPFVH